MDKITLYEYALLGIKSKRQEALLNKDKKLEQKCIRDFLIIAEEYNQLVYETRINQFKKIMKGEIYNV